MSQDDRQDCQLKLQRSVRAWLKQSKLQRFVRDVTKIIRLSKIYEKCQRLARAREWFQGARQ
jgi:hypothetical protein